MAKLTAMKGDITTLRVDAIVNAANETLLGGGGVDGAIHAAAGPSLLAECERIPEIDPGVRCRRGEARITHGHLLPARHVIHTVGPVWDEAEAVWCDSVLASCYRQCMALAVMYAVRVLAFPCISTGAYGFPTHRAAQIAVTTVRQAAHSYPGLAEVIFVCLRPGDLLLYQQIVK